VLTTLHTNDAISTIPRLKDIGPDPGLISDAFWELLPNALSVALAPTVAFPALPLQIS